MSTLFMIIATTAVASSVITGVVIAALRRLGRPDDQDRRAQASEPTRSLTSVESGSKASSERARLLLATMSHEIRTPLNGVLGMLHLLADADLNAEQRAIVRMISDSGQVLSQVVDDYLAYYRLESGQGFAVSPSACELEDVVLQSMMQYQGMAYDKGLGFVLMCGPDAPHVVSTDGVRLRQVLANLVSNAIKYTDTGEVCVSIEAVSGGTEISVSDTGPGLDEEALDNLFEPFFRDEQTSTDQKGAGLGLSIARQLTDVLGGQMRVDSEPGMGTTFTLQFDFEVLVEAAPILDDLAHDTALIIGGSASASLALADILEGVGMQVFQVDDATAVGAAHADLAFVFSGGRRGLEATRIAQAAAVRVDVRSMSEPGAHREDGHVLIEPFSRGTVEHTLRELASGAEHTSTIDRWRQSMAESYPLSILIAEDDTVSARVVVGMLESLGYTPRVVSSGSEAVEAIDRGGFDVGLLDINLPDFGGIEILGRVAAPDTWWIAMSASVQPERRKRCREAGFRDFLAKPLSVGSIRSALVRGSQRDSGVVDTDAAAASLGQMRDLFSESPDAYRDLLESHIAQTDMLCADLEDGLVDGGDHETARRAAHTLQAGAASFGCQKVAAHARTLDVEWETLACERRRQIAGRLLDAWRDDERAGIEAELASIDALDPSDGPCVEPTADSVADSQG